MKEFLRKEFGTDKIQLVDKEALKEKLEGGKLVDRITYRRQVGNVLAGKKDVIKHGEIYRKEHLMAHHLDANNRNPLFGFACLHYSVSESSGYLRVKILNKTAKAGSIRVVTLDGEAVAPKDYEHIDEIIEFKSG